MATQGGANLGDDVLLLARVDLDHSAQEAEVVADGRRGLEERGRVLREARAAVSRSGVQEVGADAQVVAHPQRDVLDVRVDGLADHGHRVDVRDLHRKEHVRRVLDHLRRRHVGHDHRRRDVLVEVGDADRDRGVLAADHDARRLEEVTHRRPLTEELRVGRDADLVRRAAFAEPAGDALGRPDGDGRLGDHGGARRQDRGDLADDRLDRRQVGFARVALGRLDAEEDELGPPRRLGGADHELQAPRLQALGDQRRQALLQDRHLALAEPAHLVGVEVGRDDVVAQPRQARCRGEPDVAGADDRDAAHGFPAGRAPRRTLERGSRDHAILRPGTPGA